MARLSDDSAIRSQILPSIWAGYRIPFSKVKPVEDMPVQDVSRFIY